MKDKIKAVLKLKYTVSFLLALIILLQLLNITNVIINRKKSYHLDEILSYGLSNNFYQAYIERLNAWYEPDVIVNMNQWISGDALREYVTVQKGEQFRYDSVWYNQSVERHPPLFYAVLHTICSFFPDTFSPVFGYIINFACFIATQIFLYKLSRNILKSKYLALTVCTFWGFSTGAIDLTIFIRMYCMLAMWTVIFLYLHSKLIITDTKPLLKQLIPVMAVTLCGALTQYLFLFVAFITAVCFCIRYICKKQFKTFFAYGFSMLGAVISAMLIFPAYLPNMLTETGNSSKNFWDQYDLCIRYILNDIFPFTKSTMIFWFPVLSSILITLLIMSLPVLWLLRDKQFVIDFFAYLKNSLISLKNISIKKISKNTFTRIKKINFITLVIFLCIASVIAVTAHSISFFGMTYTNRYLFIIYPAAALLITCIIHFLFFWSRRCKNITAFILILVTIIRLPAASLSYLFDYQKDIDDLGKLTADSECIFVACDFGDTWMVNYLPSQIYDVENIFLTYLGEQSEHKKDIESIKTDHPVYLIFQIPQKSYGENGYQYFIEKYDYQLQDTVIADTVNEEEFNKKYLDFYKELSITKSFEYIGTNTIFARQYAIYRLA